MVFTYLKFQSGETWVLSTVLTVFAFVCFYTLFVRLLNLPFPDGSRADHARHRVTGKFRFPPQVTMRCGAGNIPGTVLV